MDSFEVLGVSPRSTGAEVAAAYRRRARELHPDAHPGLSRAERHAYELAMARLNHAYESVKSMEARPVQSNAPLSRTDVAQVALPDGDSERELDRELDRELADLPTASPLLRSPRRPALSGTRYLAAVLVFAIALTLFFVATSSRGETMSPAVGDCVTWVGGFVATPCTAGQEGVVVRRTDDPISCASGESFIRSSGKTFCVRTSR